MIAVTAPPGGHKLSTGYPQNRQSYPQVIHRLSTGYPQGKVIHRQTKVIHREQV